MAEDLRYRRLQLKQPQVGNRYPMFEKMREAGPIIRKDGVVRTTTREAATIVFRNPDWFSSVFPNIGNTRPMIPIQIDPPEHRRYRRIFDPLFSRKEIAGLREPIAKLVNELIDGFFEKGECTFDREFAIPLPSQVFLTFVGLPLSDLDLLLELKDGIIRPGYRERLAPDDLEGMRKIQDATGQRIYEYFQTSLDERRKRPTDDMLTRLLTSEFDGYRLTDEEILDTFFLMLIAGLDTITNSLTLFYTQFVDRPDLRTQIVEHPELIPAAVEELLRWETPTPGVPRVATRDGEILGCPVHAGDQIQVDLGAANTDRDFLPDADQLRFDRPTNRHYSFSGGIHRCLGSHLARQELRVALREWHRRIPDYALKPGVELIWPPGLRSVENLVLTWPIS